MIDALSGAINAMLKKPLAIVPLFLAYFASVFLSVQFQIKLLEILFEAMNYNMAPHAAFFFARMHGTNILYALGLALANTFLLLFSGVYYCRYVSSSRDGSIGGALKFALKSAGNIIVLLAVMAIFFIAVIATGLFIAMMPIYNVMLYAAAIAAYLGIVFVIALRLFMFALPALAKEKSNAKNALKESWNITKKFFWPSLLLAIVLTFFVLVVSAFQEFLLNQFEEMLAVFTIISVFGAVSSAFCLGTLTIYYSQHAE